MRQDTKEVADLIVELRQYIETLETKLRKVADSLRELANSLDPRPE